MLWIAEISSQFQFYPETFALAISILNRLLASVKVETLSAYCLVRLLIADVGSAVFGSRFREQSGFSGGCF